VPILHTTDADLHWEAFGRGEPVTVFAHGLGSDIGETRPLAGGVAGTRVFLDFRGHGATTARGERPWDFDTLAADLRAVADETHASRALGVSLGAATLLRLLVADPTRFERAVLFLPALLDAPRDGEAFGVLSELARCADAGDVRGVEEMLFEEAPPELRLQPGFRSYTRERARALTGSGFSQVLRAIAGQTVVADVAELAALRLPVLVVAQEEDPVHPAAVARRIAAALPDGRLEVFERAEAVWLDRTRLRSVISGFLNG
jgi:pimeloyl-ACP methyl ester carboxylesterase